MMRIARIGRLKRRKPMTITLTPDVAAALAEKAKQQGTTPEALAVEKLRECFLASSTAPLKPRTPGLGSGQIVISDDFDEPLPEEFWFGDISG
jgi:hypothetical protein